MSRNYKFHDPAGLYFVSFAAVFGIDVFVRRLYFSMLTGQVTIRDFVINDIAEITLLINELDYPISTGEMEGHFAMIAGPIAGASVIFICAGASL